MALFSQLTEAAMPSRYQTAGLLVWQELMMDRSGCFVQQLLMIFQSPLLEKLNDLLIVDLKNYFGI